MGINRKGYKLGRCKLRVCEYKFKEIFYEK